jgi:hypothetical protein
MTASPERAARVCHSSLNALHAAVYFAPEFTAEFARAGVDTWHAAYFASRAGAMGPVGAAPVTATFNVFKRDLIARHIPGVWAVVPPRRALEVWSLAADTMLRRLLGEAATSDEMAEAADLAVRAIEACAFSGRPLSAALAELPVPDTPHMALWHAAGVLREHRGDGHVMVLVNAGLDGLEAQVTHTATGKGFTPAWVARTRGWSPADWAEAQQRLRTRGLLDDRGELTEAGVELRRHLESETDRLAQTPYTRLGPTAVERLTELATRFAKMAAAGGAYPADLLGKN